MYQGRSLSTGADSLGLMADSAIYQHNGFGQIISSLGSCFLICKQRILILVVYLPEFIERSNEIMAMHGRDAITCSLNSFHFPFEHTARLLVLAARLQWGDHVAVFWPLEQDAYYFPPDSTLLSHCFSFSPSRCQFSKQAWEPCVEQDQPWTGRTTQSWASALVYLHWTENCIRNVTDWINPPWFGSHLLSQLVCTVKQSCIQL